MPESAVQARPDAFVVAAGEAARQPAHLLARDLRQAGLTALVDYEPRSLKAQMKRANRAGARRVLILGDDELAHGDVTVREMAASEQATVRRDAVVQRLVEARRTAENGER